MDGGRQAGRQAGSWSKSVAVTCCAAFSPTAPRHKAKHSRFLFENMQYGLANGIVYMGDCRGYQCTN